MIHRGDTKSCGNKIKKLQSYMSTKRIGEKKLSF